MDILPQVFPVYLINLSIQCGLYVEYGIIALMHASYDAKKKK